MFDYDLIVIGAGPAGYESAIKASQLGLKTLIIEKDDFGGTCLNRGCIPTKALIHSASIYGELKNCEHIGINVADCSYDYSKIDERKNNVVKTLRSGIESLISANKIDSIKGQGKIIANNTVSVLDKTITAKNILIATGAKPILPPIEGTSSKNVLTSDNMLEEDKLYKSLIIIGGGVIGVEFASIYSSLGIDCTIIEYENRVLPTFDKDISQNLSMILKKRGVKIYTSSLVKLIEENHALNYTLDCTFEAKKESVTISADAILVATGRKPNTDNLFGDNISIDMDRGFIITNNKYETSIKGIYAVGDVRKGAIQLAHVASSEGVNAVLSMTNNKIQFNTQVVPGCIYTSPEIACVGITEAEAKEKGMNYKTSKYIMSSNGKTLICSSDRGFMKLVVNTDTETIIGAQLMCERATDMISEICTAIINNITIEDLLKTIRPHPTFSEGITETLENVFGNSIHTVPSKK